MPVVATVTSGTWPATVVDRGATLGSDAAALRVVDLHLAGRGARPPEPGSARARAVVTGQRPDRGGSSRTRPAGSRWDRQPRWLAEVEVHFSSVETLDGGPAGSYRFDVYRRTPDPTSSGPVGSYGAAELRQPDGGYLLRDQRAAQRHDVRGGGDRPAWPPRSARRRGDADLAPRDRNRKARNRVEGKDD